MAYKYETHLHTCQSSACGQTTGREHARYYHALGYQGVFITDHFMGGNTAVPRDLPWREWVEGFCQGYEDALAEGQKLGLDVFFGWEQGYGGDEYLVYGLDKQWLLDHPQIAACSRAEQLRLVHEGGGCVIQAHPLRTRAYIREVRLGLRYCDGAEVANAGNFPMNDAAAYRYAREYGLVMTAGSDNHKAPTEDEEGERAFYGVAFDTKLTSAVDFAQRILRGEQPALCVPPERFQLSPEMEPIESFWLDAQERLVPTNKNWLRD